MRLTLKVIAASISTLVFTCAVGAASFDGKWNGNLRCDASPQNPAKLPAFSNPISMVVADGTATITRNTDLVAETLSGKVAGGSTASLSGLGKYKAKEGQWVTKIDGKFSGQAFKGSGAIYRDDGSKVRDCSAELTAAAPQSPAASKQLDAARVAPPAKPIEAAETPAVTPAVPAAPPTVPPISADTNTVVPLIDAKSFIGSTALLQEALWSDPREKVFGKRTADWTDQDFQLLEQKLRDQIAVERNVAAEYNRRVGLISSPDENSIFKISRQNLQDAIAALPKFKSWVGTSREKALAQDAKRLALERQRQVDEANRQQQEKAVSAQGSTSAPKATTMGQEVTNLQAANEKSNNLQILLMVIAAAVVGWIWNKFIRTRCPNCKSTSFDTVAVTETSRFTGTKQVTEKHSRGTNTRHVRTTFAMKLYQYRCKSCQHEWSKEKKEEL